MFGRNTSCNCDISCLDNDLVMIYPDMTMALIDSAYDDDQDVRDTIANALFNLGKKQPALVLSSCHSYLGKHAKVKNSLALAFK